MNLKLLLPVFPYSLFINVPLHLQMLALLDRTLTLVSTLAPNVRNISTSLQQVRQPAWNVQTQSIQNRKETQQRLHAKMEVTICLNYLLLK